MTSIGVRPGASSAGRLPGGEPAGVAAEPLRPRAPWSRPCPPRAAAPGRRRRGCRRGDRGRAGPRRSGRGRRRAIAGPASLRELVPQPKLYLRPGRVEGRIGQQPPAADLDQDGRAADVGDADSLHARGHYRVRPVRVGMGRLLKAALICCLALLALPLGAAGARPRRTTRSGPSERSATPCWPRSSPRTNADEALGALGDGLALIEARARIEAEAAAQAPPRRDPPRPDRPRRPLDPAARLGRLQRHHDPPPQRRRPARRSSPTAAPAAAARPRSCSPASPCRRPTRRRRSRT